MTHVATFISNPARPGLDDALLLRLAALLGTASAPCWLDAGVAADIFFTPSKDNDDALVGLTGLLRDHLDGAPIDAIVQPVAFRRKRLFVADMDSTMIGAECLDELADCIGMKPQFAAITTAAMRGDIAFEPALEQRVRLLAGLDVKAIDKVLAERISLMPGARTLVATMRAHGAVTALVSSGFTAFTQPIAARLGFDKSFGNVLVLDEGKLSGRVVKPILGQAAKRETLLRLREEGRFLPVETLAVGDGANDLDMLKAAGLGVAFRAKPKVAAASAARIEYGDLTALLYAQGFARQAFCA